MTNDLEQMLRSSLQQRAEDVEPTPELWRQVQRRVQRRRAVPLLVWTAAGVAAAVTAFAVVPALVDGTRDGLEIQPVQSPTAPDGTPAEPAPGPSAIAPLSHYVAVVDGALVLRDLDGSEEVLWEGESEVRTLAVAPGSTPEDLDVAIVTTAEGMFDVRVVRLRAGEVTTVDVLGEVLPEDGTVPTLAWNPAGDALGFVVAGSAGPELVLTDPVGVLFTRETLEVDASSLQLQDWSRAAEGEHLSFTDLGRLYVADVVPTDSEWEVGPLASTDGDTYVVDVATVADGSQYRLLAGVGNDSGDAEDAGLALEFDNQRRTFPDLATASPSDVWMTAVRGGAILGLGSDARLVLRDEDDAAVTALSGVSYAAWVPTGEGDAADRPTAPAGPSSSAGGPPSASGVAPYVTIDGDGRVAVVAGDGGEREVIVDEQVWAASGGDRELRPVDVTVRPGSSAGEVSGMLLRDGGDGRELAWFRAAADATALHRLEGATGLGTDGTEVSSAPVWSPDGRHVAWVERDEAGGWTLRTLGVADDGPTGANAGFGLELPRTHDRLHAADWRWGSEAADGTARGSLLLVGDRGGTYHVAIERQGDGALAVSELVSTTPDVEDAELIDAGSRDGELVSLWRTAEGFRLRQGSTGREAFVPLTPGEPAAFDLDVLAEVAVVTERETGWAYVVDRAGGVAGLEADAATFAYDRVR